MKKWTFYVNFVLKIFHLGRFRVLWYFNADILTPIGRQSVGPIFLIFLYNIIIMRLHSSIASIGRALYVRTYPTLLVQPDGSTITIRYKEPRRIIKVHLKQKGLLKIVFSFSCCISLTAAY